MKPEEVLAKAAECIADRGSRYESGRERSMSLTVELFNRLTGHDLSEVEGWRFMRLLKIVRSLGAFDPDHYVDEAGYAALECEAAAREAARDG